MPGYEIYNKCLTTDDQSGVGGVLTFTFTSAPKQIWVLCVGDDARADLNENDPTDSRGVFCGDGIPTPIPVSAERVNVYAPAATTVSVWGFA